MRSGMRLLPVLWLALLGACSSGGGSDGDDEQGNTLVYSGKTTPADIEAGNALDITAGVVDLYGIVGDDALRTSRPAEPASASSFQAYAMTRLKNRVRHFRNHLRVESVSAYAAREEIDSTEACESGEVRTVGYLEQDFTGELTFIFDACQEGPDLLDGAITFRIDSFDQSSVIETGLFLTFDNLRLRNQEFDVSLGGRTNYTSDISINQRIETIIDLIIKDNVSGITLRVVDLVNVYSFDNIFFPSRVDIEVRSGRVFISPYGYVDVSSSIDLGYATIEQSYPDQGTYVLLADGSIRATALSVDSVQVEADTTGDDNFDFSATVDWSNL